MTTSYKTSYKLFMREARKCELDDSKAEKLYKELYAHLDPTECDSKYVKLTTDEAILASFLLTKFGAKIRRVNYTTVKEEEHMYKVKML